MTALPRPSAHPSPRAPAHWDSPHCDGEWEPLLLRALPDSPPQQPLWLWVGSQLVRHVTAATNLAPQLALHPSFHGRFPPASLKSL